MLVLETTIALVITIGVLVVAHEWGHFIVSKLLGVRVEEFAFGFGPRLATLAKRGDTEYTIHAVPLGGFNKLAGMEPGEGEDDPQGYNAQPIWKRFLIVFAGPFMSFLLAYVVFCAMGATLGLPSDVQNAIEKVSRNSPAARAGLRPGDRIVAIDGERIRHGLDLQGIVHRNADKELVLKVRRGTRTLTISATPRLQTLGKQKVGLLGVQLTASERKKYGVVGSIVRGSQMTAFLVQETFDTFTSREKLGNVGGVVAIARITADAVDIDRVRDRLFALVLQGAMLSLTLALINALPWPILDGGHILLLLIEFIRGGRKLTVRQMQMFQAFGLATLLALVALLFYVDITRWVTGTPLG
ncbi:MAG: M50 family metallopeptidase [Armatimonadota bacterium]|nr:M50 family metallopeptidase [Armatimonadota bacterium]